MRELRENRSRHVNHITGDITYTALFLSRRSIVLTIHDVESLERQNVLAAWALQLLWLKWPVSRARFVTVVSHQTKARLLEQVPVNPGKVIVIPNPVSELFQYVPKLFQKEMPAILQIGTKQNKNLERTIKALAGIPCKLTIIGMLTPAQQELLQECRIDFENKAGLTNEELAAEYRKADIVSFVSIFEGFGMPIVEANATGRVVLTSNVSAMPEVAGNAALLVDPHSIAAIREGFLELIRNDALRETLIANGLQNAKKYQPELIARQYLALYERMLT